jgi:flagellar basal body rod protein FlgG
MLRIATACVILLAGGCAKTRSHGDAWETAGQAVAPTADVVAGIDAAKRVVAANLRDADITAAKAVQCSVRSDGEAVLTHDFSQGELEDTRRPLDVAIDGHGLFKVKVRDTRGDGYAYTRNGNFFVNHAGELVVALGDGRAIEPPVVLPEDTVEITISPSGLIQCKLAGAADPVVAGQLRISRFANPEYLTAVQPGLYAATPRSGPPIESDPGKSGAGTTIQGFLEGSNVEVARERLRLDFLNEWREALTK